MSREANPSAQDGARLIEGPIGRTLFRLTVPMIVGILSMVIFNLIDTFFIARLGMNELAAMGFTFPVVFLVGGLALGLGMGASAVISRAIGEGDQGRVRRLTTDSLTLALIVVGLLVVAGLATIDPLFKAMGATSDVMPLIGSYMRIWYPGMLFVVVPMVGNNAIRATGDTKTPSLIMLVAVAVNLVLDPLLIFGLGPFPRLELEGAAIATVIARAVVFSVALWVLHCRDRMIALTRPRLREIWQSWRGILYIGIPAGMSNIVIPLGMGVITRLVAAHGPEAVAGFGVAMRVERFALTVIMALSSVLAPFVGQNWGARRFERVRLAVSHSHRFSLGWGVAMLLLFAIAGHPIALLFNDDPIVVSVITVYLSVVPVSYGLWGVCRLSSTTLNVLNRPLQAGFLNAIQLFVLYIPAAVVGSRLFGLSGVFGAGTVANVLSGIAAYLWLKRVMRTALIARTSRRLSKRNGRGGSECEACD